MGCKVSTPVRTLPATEPAQKPHPFGPSSSTCAPFEGFEDPPPRSTPPEYGTEASKQHEILDNMTDLSNSLISSLVDDDLIRALDFQKFPAPMNGTVLPSGLPPKSPTSLLALDVAKIPSSERKESPSNSSGHDIRLSSPGATFVANEEERLVPAKSTFQSQIENRLMSTLDHRQISEKIAINRSPSLPVGSGRRQSGRKFSVRSQVLMRSFAASSVDASSTANSPTPSQHLFQTAIVGASLRSSPWSRDTGHLSPAYSANGGGSQMQIMASFFGDQGSAVDSDLNFNSVPPPGSPRSESGSGFFSALDDFQVRVMQAAEGSHFPPETTIVSQGDKVHNFIYLLFCSNFIPSRWSRCFCSLKERRS